MKASPPVESRGFPYEGGAFRRITNLEETLPINYYRQRASDFRLTRTCFKLGAIEAGNRNGALYRYVNRMVHAKRGLITMADNRIPLETLRRSLGRVARDVERGDSVVVERRGEEAFAMVPMRLYRLLEEERQALVEATGRAREAFSDLSEDEVEGLVAEELENVRDSSSAAAGH